MPEALDYLLGYYDELALSRGMGLSGWDPIRYSDIQAWSKLMDIPLEPHEVEGLLHLDVAIRFPGEVDKDSEEVAVMKDLPWPEKK